MYAGPGAGPMLAASVAWDELVCELQTAASAYSSVIAGLTSGPWLGPAAVAAAAAASPYAVWMSATAGQAEQAAGQARAAVAAYEAAYVMTVPPPAIAANRALLMALTATNFFGQNSPAIAATEAFYGEMWAQDAAAMYGYAGSSAAASTLTPFTSPPQVTDPAGVAAQATAVAEATGEAAAHTLLAQLVASVPAALQGLATPTAISGIFQSPVELLTDPFLVPNYLSAGATPIYALASVLGIAQTLQGMSAAAVEQLASEAAEVAAGAAAMGADGLGGLGGVLGSMGRAAKLGSLSVPSSWTSVIPTAHLGGISSALPGSGPNGMANVAPSLLGGVPRGAVTQGPVPGPRYGLVPTVMAQPPSAGYGDVV